MRFRFQIQILDSFRVESSTGGLPLVHHASIVSREVRLEPLPLPTPLSLRVHTQLEQHLIHQLSARVVDPIPK